MKKISFIYIFFCIFITLTFFSKNAASNHYKNQIDTLNKLLESETLTEDQYWEAVINTLSEVNLEGFKPLKKMLDDKLLTDEQFRIAILQIMDEHDQSGDSNASQSNSNQVTQDSNNNGEENTLLSEAIESIQSINPDVATKDRLALYEKAINNVAKIEDLYPGSDIALKLKTNQDIGDFSITKIRNDYLKEVLSFYDIVCEKSPSYICLGFVSLKTGQEMCSSGTGIDDLTMAHDSLLNAVKIFKGQESKSAYSNIALSSHRNCNKVLPGVDNEWSTGYFAIPLVRLLLELGEEQTSRGIIENLNDPYFKLLSVLIFKKNSNEEPDQAYKERIKKFIDENLEPNSLSDNLSKLSLTSLMLNHSNSKFEGEDAGYAYYEGRLISTELECGGLVMKYIHTQYLNLLHDIYNMDKKRWGLGWGYQFPAIYSKIASTSGVFKHCGSNDYADTIFTSAYYSTTFRLYGDLLIFNGIEDAQFFKDSIFNNYDGDQNKLFQTYVDLRLSNEEITTTLVNWDEDVDQKDLKRGLVTSFGKIYDQEEVISSDGRFEAVNKLMYLERLVLNNYEDGFYKFDSSALFKIFKSNVDYSDVCNASKLLFQYLDETPYYQQAINYMVTSPNIDPNNKYNCGDEDLELLLN